MTFTMQLILWWLGLLSFGLVALGLYLAAVQRRWRAIGRHVDQQVSTLDLTARIDRVIEIAGRRELMRDRELRKDVMNLIAAIEDRDSALLNEKHWSAIRSLKNQLQ